MQLTFAQDGIRLLFETTEKNTVILKEFSCHEEYLPIKKDVAYCNIADIHVSGENQNDHHGSRHTGNSGTFSLQYVSHELLERADEKELIFHLADDKMKAAVHYLLYRGAAVVRTWTEVENTVAEPLELEYVASFAYTGFDEGEQKSEEKIRVSVPHNAWCRELNWKTYRLSELGLDPYRAGVTKRYSCSNVGTWSTKEYLPMGMIQNLESRNTMLFQIEHNGSWQWEIGELANKTKYLKLSGPTEQECHWHKRLAQGERFVSVKAAIAVAETPDAALGELTKYRRRIFRNNKENAALPVIFNDYMNCIWADPTEEKELPLIDRAAELGAEYFCMDAGWYADGGWWETVGEWQPIAKRFPNGIKRVFDYVREKGMIPGIWLEIEVMGIHCPLAKEFEDECFFLRHGKRVIDHGRYQLDFRHPRVQEHATAVIDRVVNEYGVGYIKMDYNIDAGIGTERDADSFGDGLLEHNRAYLDWLDFILARHPSLVLECCSSGGLRMDYAMLQRGHLQSVSDQTNWRWNAPIAAAAATAVIPEQAAIWSYPVVKDNANVVALNMVNSLLQRVHLSGKVLDISAESIALEKEAIALYKQIRGDIPTAIPFYPMGLPHPQDDWFCLAHRNKDNVRVAVWRMESKRDTVEIPLEGMREVKLLYPSSGNAKLSLKDGKLSVKLPDDFSAVLIELR